MMEKWKIGGILGGVLGLAVPYIPLLWIYYGYQLVTYIPPNPSVEGSMGFYLLWSLSTVFGVLIGAIVGYLIDRYMK